MSAASTTGTAGLQAIASALAVRAATPATSRAGRVDKSANWRVKRDTGQAAHGEHCPDGRLVPVSLGQQENLDIGAEPPAHVRQEKVQPVELRAVGHLVLR